jgi:hypothetical protein
MRGKKRRTRAMLVVLLLFLCGQLAYAQSGEDAQRDWSFLINSRWRVYNIDYNRPVGPIEFKNLQICSGELIKKKYTSGVMRVYCHHLQINELVPFNGEKISTYKFIENKNGLFIEETWGKDPISIHAKKISNVNNKSIVGTWSLFEYRKPEDKKWDFILNIPELKGTIVEEGTYLVRVVDENTLETDNTFGDDHLIIKVENENRIRIIPQFEREGEEKTIKEVILTRIR